jgi:hypothetical protein
LERRPFVIATGVIFLACGGALWGLLAIRPVPAPRPAWDFPRLPIEQVKAPVPPRFAAPLPTRVDDFWEDVEKDPPLSHVRFRLLEGDLKMGERFLTALRHAAPLAESSQAVKETYGEALWPDTGINNFGTEDRGFRGGMVPDYPDAPCEWLRTRFQGLDGEHAFIRELFWWKLALCSGPEVEELFTREDAPMVEAIEQYERLGLPRLTDAMVKQVRRLLAEDLRERFVLTAAYLSRSTDPTARQWMEELARQGGEEIAQRIWGFDLIDQRQKEEFERRCRFLPTSPEGADPLQFDDCLVRWARTDWVAMARMASFLIGDPRFSSIDHEDFAVLTRFSSLEERDLWAQQRGLLPASLSGPLTHERSMTLFTRMESAKRGWSVYPSHITRRGTFPIEHDELLVTLAWMVHPELQGVVFEQIPPVGDPTMGEESGDYVLRAYAEGERFSITAENRVFWADVGAVLALLNRVLEARGSTTRFAALDHYTAAVLVAFGPEAALREANALGLLRLGDARVLIARFQEDASPLQKRLMQTRH